MLIFPAKGAYFSANWIRDLDDVYGFPDAVRQLRHDDEFCPPEKIYFDGQLLSVRCPPACPDPRFIHHILSEQVENRRRAQAAGGADDDEDQDGAEPARLRLGGGAVDEGRHRGGGGSHRGRGRVAGVVTAHRL